jgi:hypothetical protein
MSIRKVFQFDSGKNPKAIGVAINPAVINEIVTEFLKLVINILLQEGQLNFPLTVKNEIFLLHFGQFILYLKIRNRTFHKNCFANL